MCLVAQFASNGISAVMVRYYGFMIHQIIRLNTMRDIIALVSMVTF